jgi:two-component system chemotaxis sensor kinase CheA
MDHGIEKPAIRKEKGKNPVAKLRVSAQQTGGSVSIEITDDGGGIHKERVFKKALEKGIIPAGTEMSSLSEDQIFQFLFAPGFSTAEKVSDLSGRGVGLDVVKSNLEKIHGKIDIRSKIDQGTTFRLSIPLSTAITDGIVVAIAGSRFIVPIHTIREIIRAMPSDFTDVSGAGHVVRIRENLLPVVDISTTLAEINWDQLEQSKHVSAINAQSLRKQRNESMLLIVESLHGEVLLPVDDVIGQAQVVVKPVPGMKSIPEISGAAILGDGRTVLVIDPASLVFQSNKLTELTKDVAA